MSYHVAVLIPLNPSLLIYSIDMVIYSHILLLLILYDEDYKLIENLFGNCEGLIMF